MAISLESELRVIVQRELQVRLAPLNKAVGRLAQSLDALDMLREVTERLASLSSRLGAVAGVRTPSLVPVLGERGRPGRAGAAAKPAVVTRERASAQGESRECAVKGCERPSRSKGYCSAHYQKLRLLIRTGRRPDAWVDDAAPQSVADVTLPRGRAASQALKEAAPARSSAPAEPPKPKAWVRKKGSVGGLVSLH